MLISEDRKFLFIAVPKTGTTSIEIHLQKLDPSIRRNSVPLPGGKWVTVHKHARAGDIKNMMGPRMNEYTVIAFMREPVSAVISKYYYYKMGRGAKRARHAKFDSRGILNKMKTVSAQILPIRLWALVYPYSMTHEFVLGQSGALLVDEIGNFDKLEEDFVKIFSKFGFDANNLALPVANRSGYSVKRHAEDNLLKKIIAWRCSVDRRIFDDCASEKRSVPANRGQGL